VSRMIFAVIASLTLSGTALAFAIPPKHDTPPGNGGHGGSPVAAPEIDPASAFSALTLLAGGLAAIRGRKSKS
jgi:hypothetical protein